ncbi:acyl-CoA/acyl-ACP dehydrogenase [Desemzia sp. RIT804]|uniref:acyl-CoA dehydrogenase family protein n=1 Tax=Desemzia sp. RIT 804 TaxID=2810209 RepID=UPI001951C31D|nr:acyl-CoA dehydrogenase family protein [Desemzia sp. RIT 804]MBM6615983.1 acyl-CoA/acyl-ACP dehydrogenase [Desemzia sp. RIT 804]
MFLSEELLEEIHRRAPKYDKDNSFPYEDYKALKAAGYYKAFVPKEYGGYGLSLKEIAQEQTRLAKAAPATALGINMHQIIVGVGKYMVRHGNKRGEQLLTDAVNGHLLSFAISEPANDRVLFGSICQANPEEDGGYRFYGPKVFISMSGEATRMVTYGMDDNNGDPQSVFAYIENDPETVQVKPEWDTLGMRGTQSYNLTLEGAYAAKENILTKVAPGPSFDPVVFGIFANFEILLAATYHGLGKRALELGIEHVKKRKSIAQGTTYDQDKNIRWRIAEAALLLDTIPPQINTLADDVENNEDHGNYWMPRLSAIKNYSVEASFKTVEEMVRASGGSSYSNHSELSRLVRDVYAGLFQPSDQESLHDSWASLLLGPIEK